MKNAANTKYKYGILTTHNDDGKNQVYIPRVPINRHESASDTSPIDKSSWSDEQIQQREEENVSRSVRRARKRIREHIRNNNHTHFGTLTYDLKKYPTNESRFNRMNTVIREMRKKYGQFQYVVVPELHKEGNDSAGLIHWHVAMEMTGIELVRATNYHTGKPLRDKNNREVYNMPYWDSTGHSNFTKIENKPKVSSYIVKYMTDEINNVVGKGKKKYWSSRGEKPVKSYLDSEEVEDIKKNYKPSYFDEHGFYYDI